MNLLLMADKPVGLAIAEWLLANYRDDILLVVTTSKNEVYDASVNAGIATICFESTDQVCDSLATLPTVPDLGVLAWWPAIVKPALLNGTKNGFINTHPSLLPHNRGMHYNFWALVEQAPFGVSLHYVDEGIDTGDIVAQRSIPYTWEDNGASLYAKASDQTVSLFQETYPKIRSLNVEGRKQDPQSGSFHFAREIDDASHIDLDASYKARDLLNLLRARTFPGHPACWFREDGEIYEVRTEIRKKSTAA